MKTSLSFVSAVLIVSICATSAYANGTYQKTKRGRGLTKCLVWNDDPVVGDSLTWSGKQDDDGYASGEGTLTWYRSESKLQTGFNLPFVRHVVMGRYTGKMVHGKLSGMIVKVDQNGRTFHGKFVAGKKSGEWAAGPAPEKTSIATTEEAAQPKERDAIAVNTTSAPKQDAVVEVPATAAPKIAETENSEKPKTEEKIATESTRQPITKPSKVEPPAEGPADEPVSKPAPAPATKEVQNKYDESLRDLLGPPNKLRARGATGPHLATAEVVDLADAEARSKGYDLTAYERPQAEFDSTNSTWSVVYAQKTNANGIGEGRQLSVSVEDATKAASIKN